MAHNSKKNRRHTTVQDGDDYVYPTKKIGNQARNRKHDKNLIKAGLMDSDNFSDHLGEDEPIIQTEEEITNQTEYEEYADIDEAVTYDSLHDNLMKDCGYDWEDY